MSGRKIVADRRRDLSLPTSPSRRSIDASTCFVCVGHVGVAVVGHLAGEIHHALSAGREDDGFGEALADVAAFDRHVGILRRNDHFKGISGLP